MRKKSFKVYLAAPWIIRQDMPAIAALFEASGHQVTRRWWEADSGKEEAETKISFLKQCAKDDVKGVINADAVVVLNTHKSEGKAVEQGIAIGLEKPIIIVGKRGEHSNNVFHYLDCYKWVETLTEALEALEKSYS